MKTKKIFLFFSYIECEYQIWKYCKKWLKKLESWYKMQISTHSNRKNRFTSIFGHVIEIEIFVLSQFFYLETQKKISFLFLHWVRRPNLQILLKIVSKVWIMIWDANFDLFEQRNSMFVHFWQRYWDWNFQYFTIFLFGALPAT